MNGKLTDSIAEKALPMIKDLGYDLADLEYVSEGANWYLRFFIENEDADIPVTTDDCQKVSERLSDWLDEADPVPQAYFLEVSSPGLERLLKRDQDFARFQGRKVRVSAFAPVEGAKEHIGSLGPVTDKALFLHQDERELAIPREMIAAVRLHWDDDK